ncbi:MAG: hypothetical protein CMJ18_04865 [Phycisphaeraceae bacterium]|nr:hypothetical protein [Phycisphaeraceae bacterium]
MKTKRASGHLMLGLGLFAVLGAGGCFEWRPSSLPNVPKSTRQDQIEVELVPMARLARQDTSPDPMGRHGFRRAEDRLLVITRITTVAAREGPSQRREVMKERVWLTIPAGAPLGSRINLLKLEEAFLAGYDRDDGNGFFIRPSRTTGTVTLLELKGEAALVNIDAKVAPIDVNLWEFNKVLEVPIVEDGIRASMVQDVDRFAHDFVDDDAPPIDSGEPDSIDPGAAPEPAPADGQPEPVAVAQPVEATVGDPVEMKPTTATALAQKIAGKWFGATPEHDSGHHYEVHFQFDSNGRFVHTTGRGGGAGRGYAPGMKYGTYRVRDDHVILKVEKFVFQKQNINHLPAGGMVISLRIDWEGEKLVLSGDFRHPVGDKSKFGNDVSIVLARRDFPDLHEYRPGRNLSKKYEVAPEPQPDQIVEMTRPLRAEGAN